MTVTPEQVVADVADVLYMEVDEVDRDTDLRDQGMDSVRMMDLVERWRRAGAEEIDFVALAEDPRLTRWLEVLSDPQGRDAG